MKTELQASHYFHLSASRYASWLSDTEFVWELVGKLGDLVKGCVKPSVLGHVDPSAQIGKEVYIGRDSTVLPGTVILGPAIIGNGCVIGPNAYIRQNVVLEDDVHVGHVCEVKNALLMQGALVPHFAYVGDSILGQKAHLGAGVKLSNVRIDGRTVVVKLAQERIDTKLKKFGAILGDRTEVGCNAVLNPGTLVGPKTLVTGNTLLGGYCPPGSFVSQPSKPTLHARR